MPRVVKSTKTDKISSQNTKKEILDAYNEVLQKLEVNNPSSVILVQTRLGEEIKRAVKPFSSGKEDVSLG